MIPDINNKESQASIDLKRELERLSHDDIALYNPLDEDYFLTYDRRQYKFPRKSVSQQPRYIAKTYMKHMSDKIMNEEIEIEIEKENKRRIKSQQKAMDPDERYRFEIPLLKNEARLIEIYKMLWKGVAKEYGKDGQIESAPTSNDNRSLHLKLLDEIENIKYEEPPEKKANNKESKESIANLLET